MNSKQFTESTTSGAIASVSTPVGKTQTRGKGVYPNEKGGNLLTGKKTNKKHPNSVSEAQTMSQALANTLSKAEPGSKLDQKIKHHNSQVKQTGKGTLDKAPTGYHMDKKGYIRLGVSEAKLDEEDVIIVPGQGNRIKPGFIPKDKDRTDHEVEMAKSDLFQANKNAKKIYELIKDIPESVGLEGWVQEKIIKANDYLNTVREYLEHKELSEDTIEGKRDNFTIDDIKALERIRDLETIKTRAKELIKGFPDRRMKPEKIDYFYNRIDSLASPMQVIKLMYDLLLAGEGMKTIGSRYSTSANTYQRRFDEMTGGVIAAGGVGEGMAEGSENNFVQSNLEVWYKGRFAGWTTGKVYDDPYGKDGKMVAFKPNPREFPRDEGRILALPHSEISLRKPTSIGKLKDSGQGVAEGSMPYPHGKPEAGDKIVWYHSNHYPKLEGEVVGWKDGHLVVKSIDPSPRNTEKTVVTYRVPKNNIMSVEKQGVAEGYRVLPSIDRERYGDRSYEGLEGPFRARNGKVYYYDPKAGMAYDPDTDIYIDYDELKMMDTEMSEGSEYQNPKIGTIKANLMNTEKPTVQIRVFKHDSIRNKDYWVSKGIKTFKTIALAQAYVDRINKQNVDEGIVGKVLGGAALLAALWGIGQNQALIRD